MRAVAELIMDSQISHILHQWSIESIDTRGIIQPYSPAEADAGETNLALVTCSRWLQRHM
jgi:hypothetical protein